MGTSFSTPVIAGLCACLLEYRPMERGELIGLLHASGTRAAAPGCELGYGIPQTDVLLRMLRNDVQEQTDEQPSSGVAWLKWATALVVLTLLLLLFLKLR